MLDVLALFAMLVVSATVALGAARGVLGLLVYAITRGAVAAASGSAVTRPIAYSAGTFAVRQGAMTTRAANRLRLARDAA
jgi:hypothetical protein